jgi:energy-converting hydrogenase B subunit C
LSAVAGVVELLQGLAMIAGAMMIMISCLGLWRFKDDVANVLYWRIHILGIIDVTCIAVLLVLDYPLVALTYFLLMPVAGHAVGNARYYMVKEAREE